MTRASPAVSSWFGQLQALDHQVLHSQALDTLPAPHTPQPLARQADQAQGLRQLFAVNALRCIPVVSNPFIAFGGALLERLCTAYTSLGLSTLVVDASERARAPHELAGFDLAEGIESLSPAVSYLAARGLALRFVDANGSTGGFLDALADAAPEANVLLVHASAADLARLFARRMQELRAVQLRPIVLCDEQADSVTHAYAAIKLLGRRAGLMAHDLLLSAQPGSPRAARVAERVARCADDFLGAVLHDWVAVDPAEAALDVPTPALLQLAREQFNSALQQPRTDSGFGALSTSGWTTGSRRSALPAQQHARTTRSAALR